MNAFRVKVLTEERALFDGQAVSLGAPAYRGYLGVWANHAPLCAQLTPGKVTIRTPQEQVSTWPIQGGYLEVYGNQAVLLVQAA